MCMKQVAKPCYALKTDVYIHTYIYIYICLCFNLRINVVITVEGVHHLAAAESKNPLVISTERVRERNKPTYR